MLSEYRMKLWKLTAFNVAMFVIIIITIAFTINTYVSNQQSHSKAVAFEAVKDIYSHYPHIFKRLVCLHLK